MKSSNDKNGKNKCKIYNELIHFSETITNYFSCQLRDFLGLTTFLEQISSEFKEISSKIELPKNYSTENPDYLNINPFYNFQSNILNNIRNISEKINDGVISILKGFKADFESYNKNIFIFLISIIEDISNQTNKVNKKKEEYEKEKKNNIDYKNSIIYINYKKEVDILTKLLSDSENKFNSLKFKFEENEEKKIRIISTCLYSFLNLVHEDFDSIDNKKGEIKKLLKEYQKQDKKSINDIFPKEKILKLKNWSQYDDRKEINLEGIEIKSRNKNNSINEFYIPKIEIINNLVGIDDEYMNLKGSQVNIIDIIEDEEKIKDNIYINNFLYLLENIKPNNDLQLNIDDIFCRNIGNKYFYLDFCNKIIKIRGENKTLYNFKIFSNFEYLTNLLNFILDDIKSDLLSNKMTEDYYNSYKIFDKIICIGEKSVNEETYMCSTLSKNNIFKDKNIWINSIKNKIINLLSDICFKEYSSKNQDSVFRPDEFIKKNIFGKIEGIINFKEKNIIELCGFNKIIQYYDKLNKKQKKNVDNNALSIYHGVIKCYLRHITNYNFNLENSIDLISEICLNLNIYSQEHSIFYCYYYYDCIYTSKRIFNKNNISSKIRKKIYFFKLNNMNKTQDNYIFDLKNDHNKFIIIKKACKYLDDKDKLKLIQLGKYYEKIKKSIYKSFLKKNISIENKLNFWKLYLKFNRTKSLYNYKIILKETSTEFFQSSNNNSIIQINKDIKRTYLKKNNENTPKQIYNILISFVYSEQKIKYFQGINNIAGFLQDLTGNEEDTFYLLISLFTKTQLSDIYSDKDFQYLKTFFYTIERLVYLYLPKIYSRLKDNNIQINFFMSAYFFTLYTILYPNLPENDISFLLHLWDDFLLDGWCSFFSNWLAILKYHEEKILSLKNDQILNFLNNEIKDSELYKKINYEKFYQLKKKYKVSEELIKNLQNEISVEAGIRKVGTSTIIEGFNNDDKTIR